jgi:hypothetical protein
MMETSPQGPKPQAALRPVRGPVSITGGTERLAKPPAVVPLGVPERTAMPAGMLGSLSCAIAAVESPAEPKAKQHANIIFDEVLFMMSSHTIMQENSFRGL